MKQDTAGIKSAGIPPESLRQIGLAIVPVRNVVLRWSTHKMSRDFEARVAMLAKRLATSH